MWRDCFQHKDGNQVLFVAGMKRYATTTFRFISFKKPPAISLSWYGRLPRNLVLAAHLEGAWARYKPRGNVVNLDDFKENVDIGTFNPRKFNCTKQEKGGLNVQHKNYKDGELIDIQNDRNFENSSEWNSSQDIDNYNLSANQGSQTYKDQQEFEKDGYQGSMDSPRVNNDHDAQRISSSDANANKARYRSFGYRDKIPRIQRIQVL